MLDKKLIHEWHPCKNSDLSPFEVTPGSGKKVWWKCGKGHEWQAKISNRALLGRGCPYCSGNKVGYGNSLGDILPELSKEWHHIKNGDLTPFSMTPGSNKKIWWHCEHGHEWEASPNNRSKGRGCPYCSGRKVGYGNSLGDLNTELSKQWHQQKNIGLTPYDVTPGSKKKVWWQCSEGHEWQSSIDNRSKSGCPYCAGQRVLPGKSLADLKQQLVKEWHPTKNGNLSPYDVMIASNKKVWWRCLYGHEWEAIIANRSKGIGCPLCSNRISAPIKILHYSLKQHFKDVQVEAKLGRAFVDLFIPELNLVIEYDGSYYHFSEKNHKTDEEKSEFLVGMGYTVIRIRVKHDKYVLSAIEGKNIYSIFFDETPMYDINIANALINTFFSDLCNLLRIKLSDWQLFTTNIELNEVLSRNIPIEQSIVFTYPKLIEEWSAKNKINPETLSRGSGKKVWWHCSKGHEWEATINDRTGNNATGCPYCVGKKVGYNNSLGSKYPKLIEQWNNERNVELTPFDVTSNSHKKVWWICKHGHEWEAVVSSRTNGNGCPYCSNRKVGYGNSLGDTNAKLKKEWHQTKNNGLIPFDFLPNSGKKVWWKCEKGHEWKTTIDKRSTGSKCPYCSGTKAGYGNSFGDKMPELSKEWHPIKNNGLIPFDFLLKSGKKIWWKCGEGHEWEATIAKRSNGSGCPYCARIK